MTEKKNNKRSVIAPVDITEGFKVPERSEAPELPRCAPRNADEWVQLLLKVANQEINVFPERTATLCDEVVNYVLQEAKERAEEEEAVSRSLQNSQTFSPQEGGVSPLRARAKNISPLCSRSAEITASAHRTAVEILAARAMIGVEMDTLAEVEVAQALAKRAYEIDPTNPLGILAYVCSMYHVGRRSLDRGVYMASHGLALEIAEEGLHIIYSKMKKNGAAKAAAAPSEPTGAPVSSEIRYAARLAWYYCAAGGEIQKIRPYLSAIHEHCPAHFLLLLLLTVTNSTDDGDEETMEASLEQLETQYSDHIAVLLFSAVRHRNACRPNLSDGRDKAATLLVAALARLEVLSNGLLANGLHATTAGPSGPTASTDGEHCDPPGAQPTSQKPAATTTHAPPSGPVPRLLSFEQLATPYVPGEADHMQLSWRCTAMHWALVAHSSCRVGCYAIAATAVEGGLALLSSAPRFYPFVYADLLASKVESLLCQWAEKHCSGVLAGTASNPASILQALIAAPLQLHQPVEALSGDLLLENVGDLGMGSDAVDEDEGSERRDFVSSQSTMTGMGGLVIALEELRALPQYLIKAIDADPAHAHAYYLLGYLKVLEGIYGDYPAEQRDLFFSEASHYLTQALHRSPAMHVASYALGCMHMAQGDSATALNFFSSSLDASQRATLVPLERLIFLLER